VGVVRRLRDATLPWVLIVGAIVVFATTAETAHRAHEIDWASEGAAGAGPGFGGLWYLYVGRTIYLALQSLRVEMAAFVVVCVLLFVLPLLAFAGPLKKAGKLALLDCGALVGGHGRQVQQRWIERRPLADDAVLNGPEPGSLADTAALFDAVKAIRTVPIGRTAILPPAAPLLAALAIEMPVRDLQRKQLQAVL